MLTLLPPSRRSVRVLGTPTLARFTPNGLVPTCDIHLSLRVYCETHALYQSRSPKRSSASSRCCIAEMGIVRQRNAPSTPVVRSVRLASFARASICTRGYSWIVHQGAVAAQHVLRYSTPRWLHSYVASLELCPFCGEGAIDTE